MRKGDYETEEKDTKRYKSSYGDDDIDLENNDNDYFDI